MTKIRSAGGQQVLSHKSAGFTLGEILPDGTFSGYGAVYGNIDSWNEILAPGVFAKSLSSNGPMPALLWQHRSDKPIGVWREVREDKKGLFVKGELALGVSSAREAHELLKIGALTGLSVGFCQATMETRKDGVSVVLEASLREVSLVTFPANDLARVDAVKSEGSLTRGEFISALMRHGGLSTKEACHAASRAFGDIATDANKCAYAEAMRIADNILKMHQTGEFKHD